MLLLIDEREAITNVVTGFGQSSFDTFLAKAGAPGLASFSSPLNPMPVIAVHFITWLDKNDEFIDPILATMLAEFPAHPSAALLNRAKSRTVRAHKAAATGYPWDAALIAGVPMVNRAQLRIILERLINGAGSDVTMVDGPSGTGRSHSWFLINHVARSINNVFTVKVDLNAPVLEQQTLAIVVDHLTRKLRLGPLLHPTSVGATPETVAVRYADDVATALNARALGLRPWIVFDSLDRPVAPEIRRFVCSLVQMRLNHEINDCVFFLLGAGRDYGVADPHLRIDLESLAVFLDSEIAETAGALNALGAQPLSPEILDERVGAMRQLLTHGTDRTVCAAISSKLAELRVEVNA